MNKKFLYRDKSYIYGKQSRLSAVDYAQLSLEAYDSIVAETDYYNNQLMGGKWKNMMSFKPRNLPVFQAPELPQITSNPTGAWAVAGEGMLSKDSSLLPGSKLKLPAFDNLNRQQYFIDLFLMENKIVDWTAAVSAPWIKLSNYNGHLSNDFGKKQERIFVSIDWNKAPKQASFTGGINILAAGKKIIVAVSASNFSVNNYKGFIENNGYVSIHAGHYSSLKKQAHGNWQSLPGLGYTGESLQSQVAALKNGKQLSDTAWIKKNSSFVEYLFHTFSQGNATAAVFSLPAHPLNNVHSMRYALSVDDGPLQLVDFRTSGRSEEWKQNVLRNRAEKKLSLSFLKPGKHSLKIYAVDPGVILDAILINLGGLKNAYSSIPETRVAVTTVKNK